MTERAIIDAGQRRRALDIGGSFIVQAPAGSGKTELLTQRFLRLLAVVDHPEEICAITFTRKAAAEMRNRIVGALATASGPRPEAAHARLTWSLARAATARDAERGWQLTANPNRLRVQTFDSLAAALARQLPILSEFGAAPGTAEQAEIHYRDAARNTLRQLEDAELGPHLARLLTHLDNRQAQLEDLLAAMLARRDQWLTHVLRAPDGGDLERALHDTIDDQLRQLRQACDPAWLQALCIVAGDAATRLDADGKPNPLAALSAQPCAPGSDWQDLPAWQALAELLLTRRDELRKSWDAKLGFPPPSASGIGADEKRRRQQAKAEIKRLADGLAGDSPDERQQRMLWQSLRRMPTRGLDDDQHALLGSLFHILLRAVAELTLVFRDAGEVDFTETQMRAQRALGTPDAPTDLALALDYRLRHLLVDEFQDTSSAQYGLLATLTASWQPGDGRSLFVVGDPMQSIYRFREAEVGLYLAAREHGIGHLPLTPLTLEVNFRSTRGVVDWVNDCFAEVFPPAVDIARGAVGYAAAQAFDATDDSDAVQLHPQAGADPFAEATEVVALVRQALADSEHGQVAVLARARRHLQAIAGALKQAGMAFQAVDVDPLGNQPVVQGLYFLTRALLHPADRLAWLVVLRGPWLGLDLPDLQVVAESSARCIPERLQQPGLRAQLSPAGRQRVERLLDVIAAQLPARGRRPLRQWVEGIWLQLGGAAVAGRRGHADAQAFLALLETHETAGGLRDFARLEADIERLYAAPDTLADGRIQLMTMHKAKGLEFDTVILPGLGRQSANAATELLYWLERPDSAGQVALLMAPIGAGQQRSEPISAYLRDLQRDKDRLETTRLLYVAATRAKRRLHLLGHISFDKSGQSRAPTAGSLLERLWPFVAPAFDGLAAPRPDEPQPSADVAAVLQRLPLTWQPRRIADAAATGDDGERADADQIEYDWAGDTARHVGTLVHRQLERIAADGIAAWPAERVDELGTRVRLGLRHLGVDAAHLDEACDKALRALRQTLSHDIGRWILADHEQARCEWPLTLYDEAGARHYVIDRSFVDADGVRWIIDYKTGDHEGHDRDAFLDAELDRYRAQLDNYAALVRRLDERPIRLALYFPLLSDWRVWEYPER